MVGICSVFQHISCGQETGLYTGITVAKKRARFCLICSGSDTSENLELIDFCVQQQVGIIILQNKEDRTGIAKDQDFVLRKWIDYDLQTKIKCKAEKEGIGLSIG